MKNTNSLTIEELERRIAYFEDRLKDFIITEEQIEFIKERLRELKNAKECLSSEWGRYLPVSSVTESRA